MNGNSRPFSIGPFDERVLRSALLVTAFVCLLLPYAVNLFLPQQSEQRWQNRASAAEPPGGDGRSAESTWEWSDQEAGYLQRRGPIRMCAAPDWMPMDGIRDGRHVGMAADFMDLMARRGGLNIVLVTATSWEETYAKGRRRECDIFSMLMESPSRRSFLDFTTPYLEIPGVIVTSVNVPFVADLGQVADRPLGHMRGFAGVELKRIQHPEINLVEVDSYEEGLMRVQNGELFGLIGNMVSVGFALQESKISDLKIAGRVDPGNL
ncbi:MAG TPA: transporter substrate-binding domain-containing protein, partial [Thermoanaerobaculia bacterium]|nr:transporter substrate-binding domain-containing protein [Thermoanaerobaculia bacterium]